MRVEVPEQDIDESLALLAQVNNSGLGLLFTQPELDFCLRMPEGCEMRSYHPRGAQFTGIVKEFALRTNNKFVHVEVQFPAFHDEIRVLFFAIIHIPITYTSTLVIPNL